MSKPSYATVASSPAKGTNGQASSSAQPEAPPPYTTNPSGPSDHPPFSHGHAPSGHVVHWAGNSGQAEHQGRSEGQEWTPPASTDIARSRAQRRFWVAFLWAWGIWIFVGMVIGGGVSDVKHNPMGRHGHWSKHGNWHDDVNVYPAEERAITLD